MTKKAQKKLSRLERKFTGPNAGLVWGIWPLWFVGTEHAFHWAGVYHDLDYLLRELDLHTLIAEIGIRLNYDDAQACYSYLGQFYPVLGNRIYFTKSRAQADSDLLTNMLDAAGDDKKLIITAHIAYRVVRAVGWMWW